MSDFREVVLDDTYRYVTKEQADRSGHGASQIVAVAGCMDSGTYCDRSVRVGHPCRMGDGGAGKL